MVSMNYSNIFCIRFDFGVPLEDIFPPDDIHPRLHNLFYQTSLALANYSGVPLHRFLNNIEICLNESFQLKEDLVNGNLRYEENMSPSSFFWLIRHFFGLLPIPLFPKFTEKHVFNWEYLATQCHISDMKPSHQLISEISWSIHKLPKSNIMLIYTLIHFLRKVCLIPNSRKKIDWNNVIDITTYFSSSLFFRPYRPGCVTKTDNMYYPLLSYIIVNWRKIRICRNNERPDNPDGKLSSIWEYQEPKSGQIRAYNAFLKRSLVDCSCQTSSWLLSSEINNTEFMEEIKGASRNIINNVEETISDISLELKATATNEEKEQQTTPKSAQTEKVESKPDKGSETINLTQKEETAQKIETQPNISENSPLYEEISAEKLVNINANSETSIYRKDSHVTPKIYLKQRLLKANRSLVNVISKVNGKLRSTQESIKEKSGTKLENCKYNLLKDITSDQSFFKGVSKY